jgi:hypothetical protein
LTLGAVNVFKKKWWYESNIPNSIRRIFIYAFLR